MINCLFLYWLAIGKYYPYWLENLHILYCFLSILLTLAAADRICGTDFYQNRLHSAVSLVDKASYHIYLIHPIFIFIGDQIMLGAGIDSVSLRYLIRFVVVYALAGGMSLLWKIRWRKDHLE